MGLVDFVDCPTHHGFGTLLVENNRREGAVPREPVVDGDDLQDRPDAGLVLRVLPSSERSRRAFQPNDDAKLFGRL
jgi:hypothetical protein